MKIEALLRQSESLLRAETLERERLASALHDNYALLDSINKTMMNREKRVIELKQEVNHLCAELGRPAQYPPAW